MRKWHFMTVLTFPTNPQASSRGLPPSRWLWIALALIWCWLAYGPWQWSEVRNANAELDHMRTRLEKQGEEVKAQGDALAKRNAEVTKMNAVVLGLTLEQQRLTARGAPQAELDKSLTRIQEAQNEIAAAISANQTRLIAYQADSAEYAAASKPYTAACEQFGVMSKVYQRRMLVFGLLFIGGAILALAMHLIRFVRGGRADVAS